MVDGNLAPTASESRQDSAVSVSGANGSNSISMSVEMNGTVYTGVLFAQPPPPTPPSASSKGGISSVGTNNTMGSRTGASGGTSSGGQVGLAGVSAPAMSSTSNNSLP